MKFFSTNRLSILLLLCPLLILIHCAEDKPEVIGLNTGYYLNHNDTVKYEGMDVCKECHFMVYETYMQTGMGLSFDFATKTKSASVIGEDSILYDKFKDFYYKPFWDDSTLKVREFRLQGKDTVHSREELVNFVVGSGQHTNSHIFLSKGYAHQIPFTYYTQDGLFDFPPGFEDGHNSRFGRKIGLECMSCHNGFPDMVLGSENKYRHIPQGIDCERCHGPGEIHVKLKREGVIIDTSKYIDYSIVNPAKLSKDLQMDICARCHLQGTMVLKPGKNFYDFIPGMPLTETMDIFMPLFEGGKEDFIMASHYERMSQSKCYINSGRELSCIECHNPHISKKSTLISKYNNVCKNCHNSKESYCNEPEKLNNLENKNCVSCHMPNSKTRDIPHVRIHDHKIAIPPTPAQLEEDRVFKGLVAVNNLNTDSLTIARGYLLEFETYHADPDFLDSAYSYLSKSKSNNDQYYFNTLINYYFLKEEYNPIIKLIEKTGVQKVLNEFLNEKDYSNYDAWTSYRIAQSFENIGNFMIAKYFYVNSIELAKFNLEFQNKYGTMLTKSGKFIEAKKVFEFIISENPDYVSSHINLGYVFLNLSDMDSALKQYKNALYLDPDNIMGLLNIAAVYFMKNDYYMGSKYLKRVINIDSDNEQAKLLMTQFLKQKN